MIGEIVIREIYKGEWSHGKQHGYGVSEANSERYSGNWVNGLMHGHGILEYSNGSVYDGNWEQGLKKLFSSLSLFLFLFF